MSRFVLGLIIFLGFIQFSLGAGIDSSNGLKAVNDKIESTTADLTNFKKQQESLSRALNQLDAMVKGCRDAASGQSESCEKMEIKHSGVSKDLKLLRTQYARLTNSVNTTQQALDELNKKRAI